MSVYDINYQMVREVHLPEARRKENRRQWVDVFLAPIQKLRNLFFDSYVDGFSGADYSGLTTYDKGDQVRYIDRAVYEALNDSLTNVPPTDTDNWKKIQDVWIGLRERAKYNGTKLNLEYILNKWFETTFVQPDDVDAPSPSDIFITNNTLANDVFIVSNSSFATNVANTDNEAFVANDYSFVQASFSINVPLAVFNSLASNDADRERIIRQIADKYVIAGVLYSVVTY